MCMYFVWKCNTLYCDWIFIFFAMCVNIQNGIFNKTDILLQFDIQKLERIYVSTIAWLLL
jgi:hypothetical protein